MKIVLTGGPSAGKTSTVEVLHKSDSQRTIIVQEAAAMLFSAGFPRQKETPFLICQQRAIFYVQKELEEIAHLQSNGRTIICDRGSLDGLAYWPGSAESFFEEINSNMEEQINRYDWVIHLDTTSAANYQNSKVRTEANDVALIINQKVRDAWSKHPNRIIITDHTNFMEKLNRVLKTVHMIMAGATAKDIQDSF